MGANTTKGYFYLPALGASGQSELDLYNAGQQVADTQLPVFPQAYATGTGTAIDPWSGDCIDDALDAVPDGGTIFLRAGYYDVDGQIYSSTKSFNLIGEGIGETILVTSLTSGVDAIFIETDHCTLKGFTLDCDSMTVDGTAYSGINVAADYLVIENVEVTNAQSCGINMFECNYAFLNNIYAHDTKVSHGVHPGGDASSENMYNTYRNIYAYDNAKQGFDEDGGNSPIESLYNTYDNIHAWGNGLMGIALANMKSAVVTNCTSNGNTQRGFWLSILSDCTFTNCISEENTLTGISIYGGSSDLTFVNCIVKNNSASGVTFTDGTDGIKFIGCNIYDDQGSPTQNYSFEFYGTNTNFVVDNCKLEPYQTGMYYDDAGTTDILSTTGVVDGIDAVTGDVMYHNGTNWVRLAKGTEGQVLTMGASNIPEWATP